MDISERQRNWENLLKRVEIVYRWTDSLLTLSEKQMFNFESQARLKLPTGYRLFCSFFGSGRFGKNLFFIRTPDVEDIHGQLVSDLEIIEACKSAHDYPHEIQQILDSAYLFGFGESYVSFLFDMNSYNDFDEECDIYALDDEGNSFKLGRNFFDFVQDFCIGNIAAKNFPTLLLGVPFDISKDSLYNRTTFVPC